MNRNPKNPKFQRTYPDCQRVLRAQGKRYPRSCAICVLGPCMADRAEPSPNVPETPFVQSLARWYLVQRYAKVETRSHAQGFVRGALATATASGAPPFIVEELTKLEDLVKTHGIIVLEVIASSAVPAFGPVTFTAVA